MAFAAFTSRLIIQLRIVAKDPLLIEGQAPHGRAMRTSKRLANYPSTDFYLSAFLKMLTALSASAALSKAK